MTLPLNTCNLISEDDAFLVAVWYNTMFIVFVNKYVIMASVVPDDIKKCCCTVGTWAQNKQVLFGLSCNIK